MSKFEKNWKPAQSSGSFAQKTRETVRGPQPLKPQIAKATGQLNQEVHRLDGALTRLKTRETAIFKKTVTAVQHHDEATSKAYSNELAEVKKMTKVVTQSKIALEQITMRLQTVTDIGDFAATLAPAIGVVKNVRHTLGSTMPDAQSALGDIGTEFSSMMTDIGGLSGINIFTGSESSEEAERIMAEAAAVAEKRVSETFPEVPSASNDESIFSSGS
jgi:division protein CdvB (Snf7/Vps24/ESCRT-III family)